MLVTKKLAISLSILALISGAQEASSRELFENGKAPSFSSGQSIYADDTIGNYQIYPGNGIWQFGSASVSASGGTADSIPIGFVGMTLWEGGELTAAQFVGANLRSNNGTHWSGSPCEGEHLAKRNRERGRYDDCMTIDVKSMPVGSKQETFLIVSTTETNSGGRNYQALVWFNVSYLGFRDSNAMEWDSRLVQQDAAKKAAIAKLTSWAEQFQDASAMQMDYRKPPNTFANVPKISDLKSPQSAGQSASMGKLLSPARTSTSYVFCEGTKKMVVEGSGTCPTEQAAAVDTAH
jgi:hypothetical protein